jgi:hypothetical protein
MNKKTIIVIGATGSQGKGLVNALVNDGAFNVRAITRHPDKYSGKAHEVVFGDLTNLESLKDAFKNAYGVFVVTNFWEGADEIAQGKNAVDAAKAAGIEHFVWSTLPNVESISKGDFEFPHFTKRFQILYICSTSILFSKFPYPDGSTTKTRWLHRMGTPY